MRNLHVCTQLSYNTATFLELCGVLGRAKTIAAIKSYTYELGVMNISKTVIVYVYENLCYGTTRSATLTGLAGGAGAPLETYSKHGSPLTIAGCMYNSRTLRRTCL